MTGKRLIRMTAAAALTLAVVFSASVRPVPAKADTLSQLQQKQAQLQQQSKALDSQLAQLKNNKAQQQQYRDALAAQAQNMESQIDSKNALIQQLDNDLITKQNQIAAKQKDINTDFQKLKQRVYALYLTGEASNLEIILNAKNVMDLADKSELLQVISKHDTDLMNAIKDDMNSIAAQKAEIEKNRKAASDAKTALVQNQQKLNTLAQEAEQALSTMSESEQEIEAEQKKSGVDQSAAAAAIQQYLASYNNAGSSGGGMSSGSVSGIYGVASRYTGTRYVSGGASPSGFDCSGFVSYVLKQCGWSLNGASRMGCVGLSNYCSKIFSSSSSLRPGDLVFYNDYGHVGIYVGNGMAIQCDGDQNHSQPGVRVVSLSGYWGNYITSYGRLP